MHRRWRLARWPGAAVRCTAVRAAQTQRRARTERSGDVIGQASRHLQYTFRSRPLHNHEQVAALVAGCALRPKTIKDAPEPSSAAPAPTHGFERPKARFSQSRNADFRRGSSFACLVDLGSSSFFARASQPFT